MNTLVLLGLVFLVVVKPAQAYLDPGAGSYFIQIAIGTALAGLYLIKNFWKSIIAFVRSLLKKVSGKTQ